MPEQPTSPEASVPVTPVSGPAHHSYLIPLSIFGSGCMVAAAVVFVSFSGRLTDSRPNIVIPQVEENIEEFDLWQTPPATPDMVEKPLNESEMPLIEPDYTDYSSYYKNIPVQAGVEWYQHPIPKDDLGLIHTPKKTEENADGWYQPLPPQYYQIGSYNGQPILYVEIPCDGMCFGNDYAVFVGSAVGDAILLTNHTTQDFNGQYSLYKVAADISWDDELIFAALKFSPIDYQGASLTSGGNNFFTARTLSGFFANSRLNPDNTNRGATYENIEFLADTEYGPLFRAYNLKEEGTADFVYAIRTVGGLLAYYDLSPEFFSDDRVPAITWNDGTKNTTMYRMDGLGSCGGGGPEVAVTRINDSDLEVAGTASTGETVYTISNPYHVLITRVFDATQGTVYDYNEVTGESQTYTITPTEFIASRGVIVTVDDLGYQNVYTNGDYGPQAECAKPVIYLYPTATTTISVDVDALITKSDPVYQNGWTVEARPTGELVYNGATYTSLFWDGYGNGVYPELKEGFVVRTDEALALMEQHLAYMGFNEKEISEFSEFWKPHLPSEPYTKFSWIQTNEMQQLAALKISPRPQTFIRAFVDFTGINEMENIAPQVLIPKERVGYVATEWGGLLRK